MFTKTLSIPNIDAARAFVGITAKYPRTIITLISEEYKIDAHSIIGILSLDLSRPITLEADGEGIDTLELDLEPFTV